MTDLNEDPGSDNAAIENATHEEIPPVPETPDPATLVPGAPVLDPNPPAPVDVVDAQNATVTTNAPDLSAAHANDAPATEQPDNTGVGDTNEAHNQLDKLEAYIEKIGGIIEADVKSFVARVRDYL